MYLQTGHDRFLLHPFQAKAQAVCGRLLTAGARLGSQVKSCGNCDGQSGTGAGYVRELRSPLLYIH
jgi:hypothetical protein